MSNDPRAVLLKPGDLLVIGNVGQLPAETVQVLHEALGQVKEALGISGVVIFESDVSISAIEERAFKKAQEANRD